MEEEQRLRGRLSRRRPPAGGGVHLPSNVNRTLDPPLRAPSLHYSTVDSFYPTPPESCYPSLYSPCDLPCGTPFLGHSTMDSLAVLPRAPSCRPWFLLEDSKSEPWAALLRSTVSGNVDLTPNNQPLPPLPAFSSQVCPEALMGNGLGEDSRALGEVMVLVAVTSWAPAFQESLPDPEPTVPPEVFTVGSKTFSWTPFPPALGGSGNSYQLFHGTGGSLGSPTPSLKGCPAPDSRQIPSTQECVSMQSSPVLLSCPLCQKAFEPTLAKPDVDSHLAQCLAESTEDVVW
ncbi:hypothetical protein A6R68_20969 [Neotoma lepida]|uniref:UBZ2-type domain-containing protein n=1 Tax=Neotoma lepida TaxID=56216 RepID=A0A1A6HRI9_NEOLE|nr:hypothetical protein A6R68_20969 [Neotoma lepida]